MVTGSNGGEAATASGPECRPQRPPSGDPMAARAAILAEVGILAGATGWVCVDVRALAARLRLPVMRVRRLLGDLIRAGALHDAGLGVLAPPCSDVPADDPSLGPRSGPRPGPHAPVHDGTASAMLW
jgi:hypothetical protein